MLTHTLITIFSYFAFLLLIMPATITGILATAFFLILGTLIILINKTQIAKFSLSIPAIAIALYFVVYLGIFFYSQWLPSSMVHAICEMLHIPPHRLVVIATIFLCICSIYSLSKAIQPIHEIVKVQFGRQSFTGILSCSITTALATVMLSQLMIDAEIMSMGFLKFCLNVLIVWIVILSLFCITSRINISVTLATGFFMMISTANVYVYRFRGRLFEPVDLFSISTAMNVADNYSLLPVPYGICFAWLIWIILVIWVFRVSSCTKYSVAWKQRGILAAGCLAGAVLLFFYTYNLSTYHWDKDGAIFHGYILDFSAKIKEANINKPDGYSSETIEELVDNYVLATMPVEPEKKPPHIIVIMDEAFSDLNVHGTISTNTEVIPFISSMNQNTISGYALSSVFGGNTSNSEYEFLTGNTMAWMSPNTVPYQQYMHTPTYSMVSYLKTYYSYNCVAIHPYLPSGWNRPEAYASLGFDVFYSVEDFPQKQYIRTYVSDQEMFEVIIDLYEAQGQEPLFLFGVSVQNHGSYSYSGENYVQSIFLTNLENNYPDVEQYLSLIHETDKAVEYLISYFEQAEDDVVVVFFGDHQPKLEESFYSHLSGNNYSSLDSQQKMFMVPFFVWANYDLEEKYISCTSLNYLSSYVYDAAGIALPPYNQFLKEMESVIPAINANGFFSLTAQCYLPFHMASKDEQKWLIAYEQLQYNNMADIKNRNEAFFPTP